MIFFLLPVTGAIIGWITNVLAIRLLFRPLKPVRLWPFSMFIQGLIPRRRSEIAVNVGAVVAEQLFSVDELTARLNMPELRQDVEKAVRLAVERWCSQKMGAFPGAIRDYCSSVLRDLVAAEVAKQFPSIAESVFVRMREQIDVRTVVADKINGLALEDVESLVLTVAQRELRQIEWLGAFLGLLIGLLQALLVWWLA